MSAALGLSGVVHGGAPDSILVPANIILGVMIGLRFKGISWPELRMALGDGFAGFVIAMVIAVVGGVLHQHCCRFVLGTDAACLCPSGV